MDKVFLPFYYSWRDKTKNLSDEEFGRLTRAILLYSETGELTSGFSDLGEMAYEFITDVIKRSQIKSEIYRQNINKRWNKENSNTIELQLNNNCTPINTNINKNRNTNTNTNTNTNIHTPPTPSKEWDELFELFWQAYPKKVGKGYAKKLFDKLKPSDELVEQMIRAIEAQKQSIDWKRDGGQYIPHPSTWLNQGRWEDSLTKVDDHGSYEEAEEWNQRELERMERIINERSN
jgi:hypothetical protein